MRYPVPVAAAVVSPSHDIVTASPPVSPRVVARILTIQNTNVTWGTLATRSDFLSSIICTFIVLLRADQLNVRNQPVDLLWSNGPDLPRCARSNRTSSRLD